MGLKEVNVILKVNAETSSNDGVGHIDLGSSSIGGTISNKAVIKTNGGNFSATADNVREITNSSIGISFIDIDTGNGSLSMTGKNTNTGTGNYDSRHGLSFEGTTSDSFILKSGGGMTFTGTNNNPTRTYFGISMIGGTFIATGNSDITFNATSPGAAIAMRSYSNNIGNILAENGNISFNASDISLNYDNTDNNYGYNFGAKAGTTVTSSNANIFINVDNLATMGKMYIDTTGTLSIQSNASSWATAQTINLNDLNITRIGGIKLGKTGNTSDLTVTVPTINGNIEINGQTTTLNSNVVSSTGDIIFNTNLSSSNPILVETNDGNIYLNGDVTTTDTSSSAIIFNAGKDKSYTDSTGGNIIITGTPTITMGSGGRALFYSGDDSLSTGLTSLATRPNIRYSTDETTNLTLDNTISSSGIYGFYRGVAPISLSYNLSNLFSGSVIYNGAYQIGSNWTAENIFGSSYNNWVLGTDYKFVYGGNNIEGFKNVGIYSNIGIDILKSGFREALSGNTNGSFTITAKALTISGLSSVNKVYDGTTTASVNGTAALQSSETAGSGTTSDGKAYTGDTVSLSGTVSGAFNDKDVADATTVAFSGLSLTGADAGNYTLTPHATVSNSITAKALTISGADSWLYANDKTYDGSANTTVDILFGNGMASVNGLIGNEALNITAEGLFNNANAGNNKNVDVSFNVVNGINGGLASNYEIANINKQANILKKYISVTGNFSANDKTYDGNAIATFATNNIILDSVVSGESLTLSGLGLQFINKNVGNGKTVRLIGGSIASTNTGDANNYIFTLGEVPPTTTANIIPKALTITSTVNDKEYDGTTNATVNLGTLNGLVGNETLGNSAVGTFNSANAGDRIANIVYTLSNGTNGELASNYVLVNSTANANISKKALTISGTTVNDKVYDGNTTATVNIGTLNGLVGNETLSTSAIGTFDNSNAGTRTATFFYTLIDGLNGGLADNYSLANTTSNAEITKADVTYSVNNDTKTAGQTFTLPTPTFTGGTPTGTATVKVYDSNNVDVTAQAVAGTLGAGTYKIKTILTDDNYNIPSNGNSDGILTINSNINVNDIITNIVNNAIKPIVPTTIAPLKTDVTNVFDKKVSSSIVNNTTSLDNSKSLGSSALGLNEVIRTVKPDVNTVSKDTKLTVVGETGGEGQIAVVELQDLVAKSGGEVRVALSPDSFVELVNGGVNLPKGVSQEFYVVEDKK